jgi:uncharacterized protein YaaN involved in tellurite resistance
MTEPVDETTPAIEIDFGFPEAAPLPVAPEPPAPVSQGLARVAENPTARQGLVCSNLLRGASLAQARQQAADLYKQMLPDQSKLMAYGTEALMALNQLVERLLHEVEPVRIPELNGMLGQVNRQMLAIKGKYDVKDPKFQAEYKDFMDGVKRRFRKVRDFAAMMKADIQSIETQLAKLEKDLAGRQHDMTRNVVYYNALYAENEKSITELIRVIAVMELIVEEARRDAANIVVGDASLGDRGEEQKQQLADFISSMEVKITDYKGRLFVAWATSPQTRMMRSLDVGMANKLNQLVQVTIPQMKLVLVQWRMMVATFENAQVAKAVSAMSNQWTREFFEQGAVMMPTIAEAINEPQVWPETMHSIADALTRSAEGVLAAYQAGDQKRREVDEAMIESGKALSAVHKKIDATVIGRIVGSASSPVPVEVITSVPKSITAG